MWQLIPNSDRRQFTILEILFGSSEPITIGTLADKMEASIRVIKYDINEINQSLAKYKGQIEASNEGVSLVLPSNIGLDFFQRGLLKNTLAFNFLEIIFFNEHLNSKDMEERLFISTSSMNRLVAKIKDSLTQYGLTLKTGPYRISGNEHLIRNFYLAYFKERYTSLDWPFPTVERDILDANISNALQYYDITTDLYEYHHFRIRFAVDIVRAQKGYLLKEFFDEGQKTRERQLRMFTESVQSEMDRHNVSSDEIRLYFGQMVNWKYFVSFPFLEERMKVDSELANNFNRIKEVITYLAEKFGLPNENQTYLPFELHNLLEGYAKFPADVIKHDYFLFNTRDQPLLLKYKEDYSFFYEAAAEKIMELCDSRGVVVDEQIFSKLLSTLILRWPNLSKNLYYHYYRCKVLIFSDYSERHAFQFSQELRAIFNHSVTFDVYNSHDLTAEKLAKYDFDILISTITVFLDIKQPIIYLQRVGTELLLKPLNEAIDNVKSSHLKPK